MVVVILVRMDIALVLLGLLVGALGVALALRGRAAAPAVVVPDDRLLDAVRAASAEAAAAQGAQLGEQLVQLAAARYGTLQERTDVVLEGHTRAVGEGLDRLAERLAQLERERSAATTEVSTLVKQLAVANEATRSETAALAAALRDNRARGVWGEVQLRRVLELAGMDRHADFIEQRGTSGAGGRGRPDVVVPLANGRCVVIDAKVPLDRYLDAVNATDPQRQSALLAEHAKAVELHVRALAAREYVAQVDGAVDLVLLFLPGDAFLAAALDGDPGLFERSAARNVHLVTPSSLVPVLRGIALGWQEQRASEAAAEIRELGKELHERIVKFAEHHAQVGAQLGKAVDAYNQSVGSLDGRLLVTARKLADHGAGSSKTLPSPATVDAVPRTLRAVELPLGDLADPAGSLDLTTPGRPALAPVTATAPVAESRLG